MCAVDKEGRYSERTKLAPDKSSLHKKESAKRFRKLLESNIMTSLRKYFEGNDAETNYSLCNTSRNLTPCCI